MTNWLLHFDGKHFRTPDGERYGPKSREPKLTPWFYAQEARPVRRGWYDFAGHVSMAARAFWTGKQWENGLHLYKPGKCTRWRGLTQPI